MVLGLVKIKRKTIGFVLRYGGIGFLVATSIYAKQNRLDLASLSLLFLAFCFIISSLFWK
jgi:hypothetical protein